MNKSVNEIITDKKVCFNKSQLNNNEVYDKMRIIDIVLTDIFITLSSGC